MLILVAIFNTYIFAVSLKKCPCNIDNFLLFYQEIYQAKLLIKNMKTENRSVHKLSVLDTEAFL